MSNFREDQKLKNLRWTLTPYIGQAVIFAGVTGYLAYVAHSAGQWGLLWASAVIWVGLAVITYIGLQYNILWDDRGVVMRASGASETRIDYNEISEITYEVGSDDSPRRTRPFRRFVLYGRDAVIDISLRHFRLEDIDELMAFIRARRPDLESPAVPMKRRYL